MALGKISKIVQSSNLDVHLIEEIMDGLREVFQEWVWIVVT